MYDNNINELRIEAARNIRIILEDFSVLNPTQLSYSSHLHRCSIIEILINLKEVNNRFLDRLQSVMTVNKSEVTFKINTDSFGKYLLQRFMKHDCRKKKVSPQDTQDVFNILKSQQQRLNELIINFSATEIYRNFISITFFGIIKLSIGEYVKHILECQRQHIIQARRVLMVQ